MKKLIILSLIIFGCSPLQTVTLKGNYNNTQQKEIDKPFDIVWSSVIDVLAQKGLEVKTIDRASGIVISEKTEFKNLVTTENSDGTLKDINAFVVVEPKQSATGTIILPEKVLGSWNIRVKELAPGKTIVNINITGIEAIKTIHLSYSSPVVWDFGGRSTGVFEKWFFAELEK